MCKSTLNSHGTCVRVAAAAKLWVRDSTENRNVGSDAAEVVDWTQVLDPYAQFSSAPNAFNIGLLLSHSRSAPAGRCGTANFKFHRENHSMSKSNQTNVAVGGKNRSNRTPDKFVWGGKLTKCSQQSLLCWWRKEMDPSRSACQKQKVEQLADRTLRSRKKMPSVELAQYEVLYEP